MVIIQIRMSGSSPIIYQELTEHFLKFFQILVVMFFVRFSQNWASNDTLSVFRKFSDSFMVAIQ